MIILSEDSRAEARGVFTFIYQYSRQNSVVFTISDNEEIRTIPLKSGTRWVIGFAGLTASVDYSGQDVVLTLFNNITRNVDLLLTDNLLPPDLFSRSKSFPPKALVENKWMIPWRIAFRQFRDSACFGLRKTADGVLV